MLNAPSAVKSAPSDADRATSAHIQHSGAGSGEEQCTLTDKHTQVASGTSQV